MSVCPVAYVNGYQEASVFLKKRAVLEEEYGKTMQKLARTTSEVYSMNDGKAGLVRNLFGCPIFPIQANIDNPTGLM